MSDSSSHSRSDAIGEKWEHAIISDALAAEAFLELARALEEQYEDAVRERDAAIERCREAHKSLAEIEGEA